MNMEVVLDRDGKRNIPLRWHFHRSLIAAAAAPAVVASGAECLFGFRRDGCEEALRKDRPFQHRSVAGAWAHGVVVAGPQEARVVDYTCVFRPWAGQPVYLMGIIR